LAPSVSAKPAVSLSELIRLPAVSATEIAIAPVCFEVRVTWSETES
jgi:hypothetical protein